MTCATDLAYYRLMTRWAASFLLVIVGLAGFVASAQVAQDSAGKKFSVADLQKLKWIEGTWRGTGDVEAPFFERYRFENETTLVVDSFTDETLTKLEDTTRFELRDGQFGNGGEGARWSATAIDYQGVTFEPMVRARNSFRWQRESDKTWTAILKWPAAEGKLGRQRIYKMERWPK